MTIVGGRRAPSGRGNRRCVCEHGPGVHPPTGPCSLYTYCGCLGWSAADEHTSTHQCQRSDDVEAALWALTLFGHLSGANRAQLGYPVEAKIQALRLSGKKREAQAVEFAAARRTRVEPASAPINIPQPRQPIETRTRKSPTWGDLSTRYGRRPTP